MLLGSIKMTRFIALVLLVLGVGLAPATADECTTSELHLPDLNALKLPDGDQIVATVATGYGNLEVHVDVKGGIASEPKFVLRDKPPFKKSPRSELPRALRACLAKKTSGENWYTNVAASALDWLLPAANARNKWKCIVKTWCLPGGCCAKASCNGSPWQTDCEVSLWPLD